jgi:hypothetical protein
MGCTCIPRFIQARFNPLIFLVQNFHTDPLPARKTRRRPSHWACGYSSEKLLALAPQRISATNFALQKI